MTKGSTWNRWELHMHTPFTKKMTNLIFYKKKKKNTLLRKKEMIIHISTMKSNISGKNI